jgi:hypothetical protein
MTQEQDGIFRSQHGSSSIVHLEKASGANGFLATVTMAVAPELTPPRWPRGQGTRRSAAAPLEDREDIPSGCRAFGNSNIRGPCSAVPCSLRHA